MDGLLWIDSQKEKAILLLKKWACINSWSENSSGLKKMGREIVRLFSPLSDQFEEKEETLCFSKRKDSFRKILLGGHMDTVFPPYSPFQKCREEGTKLIGPGVADMKGGLIVLWLALSAFEKFSASPQIGWELVISPDEEIGSPKSRKVWEEKAKHAEMALLFEPSFPDGALVGKRKGSMNFSLVIQGRAAHVGRDFHQGRSAIYAIALFINAAYERSKSYLNLTLNVGMLKSDSPLNVVAKEASCSINIRSFSFEDLKKMKQDLIDLTQEIEKKTETYLLLTPTLEKFPKPFPEKMFDILQSCTQDKLITRESGGLSEGNILSAAGLPCLDTLGVIGGNLHTDEEYMEIGSMVERAKLTFLFLCKVSNAITK